MENVIKTHCDLSFKINYKQTIIDLKKILIINKFDKILIENHYKFDLCLYLQCTDTRGCSASFEIFKNNTVFKKNAYDHVYDEFFEEHGFSIPDEFHPYIDIEQFAEDQVLRDGAAMCIGQYDGLKMTIAGKPAVRFE